MPEVDGADREEPADCDGGTRLLESYRRLYGGKAKGERRFRHLVALVPDPVESEHTPAFDLVLEGVEEAVTARVDEEISIPRVYEENGIPRLDVRPPDVVYVRDGHWFPWPDARDTKKKQRCWETQPGVILYRPAQKVTSELPVAVFLVGDTPTWGLRRQQLENALELVDTFGVTPGSEREYLILGPTFSGSADSLFAVLRKRLAVAGTKTRFLISSGTARSSSVKDTVEAAGSGGSVSVSYFSAALQDVTVLEEMRDFLLARGGRCRDADGKGGNIVVFTENLTAYGALAGGGRDNPAKDCFIQRAFPPNLESIRRAYLSADRGAGAAPAGIGAPIAAQRHAGSKGNEMSDTTPIAHDLALGAVLRRIGGAARFVGILATDPRDVVVLAKRIRQQLPDVRLFTIGADILYLHPRHAQTLNGMLVAHSVPIRPTVRTAPDSASLYIEVVRNVFRAGRFLLDDKLLSPAVRISFIGNGSLWPIGGEKSSRSITLPLTWWFAFLFFLVAGVGVWGLVLAPRSGWMRRRGTVWSLLAPCAHPELADDDRFVTASLLSVSACPVLLMAVGLLARNGDQPSGYESAALVALTVVMIAWTWARVFMDRPRASRTTKFLTRAAAIAAALALALACGRSGRTVFNLFSGGSPILVGLIGMGSFGLALWCARVRLRMLDVHRFGVPDRPCFKSMVPPIAQALGLSPGDNGIARMEQRLLAVLHNPWAEFTAVPAVIHVLLAASIAVPFAIKFPHTFEAGWRNWALVGFGCVAVLPVTGNLSRLLATWITFRRMLRLLSCVPAALALRRLAPEQTQSLDAQLTHPSNDIADLAYPVAALGRLSGLHRHLKREHEACARLLTAELADEPFGTKANPCTPQRAELVDRLLMASGALARSRGAHSEKSQALIDDFTASLLAVFIPRYVRHFRLFLPPVLIGSLVSVFMTSLYFVQPQRLIASLIFVWVAAIVGVMFMVYLALDRDPVISTMAKSTANQVTVNWGLLRRVVTWGVVPAASLMTAQFPEFGHQISTLLDAATKVFR